MKEVHEYSLSRHAPDRIQPSPTRLWQEQFDHFFKPVVHSSQSNENVTSRWVMTGNLFLSTTPLHLPQQLNAREEPNVNDSGQARVCQDLHHTQELSCTKLECVGSYTHGCYSDASFIPITARENTIVDVVLTHQQTKTNDGVGLLARIIAGADRSFVEMFQGSPTSRAPSLMLALLARCTGQ